MVFPMSPEPHIPRSSPSIRLTLTLWYIGILTAILGLFGWMLYTNVAANLAQDVDRLLASQADGTAESIFAFWEAGRAGPLASHRTIQADINNEGRFLDLVTRWANGTGELETVRPVRLIDRGGKPLVVSNSFTTLALPLTEAAVAGARHGDTVYETLALSEYRVRLITRPVIEDGRVLYLVQVATPLRQMDLSLGGLRLWLLWLIPSTLVVTSAVGWFLATLALRPVGRMVAQVRRIHAEHLHQRVDVPRTGDEVERLAATFNDMLARLERAFRRLRQFSAAASHELRTPLTVMKGELEVALRKPRDVDEYQRVLRTNLEVINEMSGTVDALLTLARSEASEGAVAWRPVELTELATQVREAWRTVAGTKAIRVEVVAHEPVWVRGERRLLERLLANLLDNALKHTPTEGLVTIEASHRNGEACVMVNDTGPGIPPEELSQIFERFFSQRASSERPHSSGLGLGLCRWIAEVHQGRIEASSSSNHGATFTVFLPRSTPPV